MRSIVLAFMLLFLFSDVTFADTLRELPSEPSAQDYKREDAKIRANPEINPAIQADDQSNDASQLELIARIRQEIVNDENFSIAAQNVTIVSNGESRIVLRGDVPNATEKSRLVNIARKHAGQVQDEIVIKG